MWWPQEARTCCSQLPILPLALAVLGVDLSLLLVTLLLLLLLRLPPDRDSDSERLDLRYAKGKWGAALGGLAGVGEAGETGEMGEVGKGAAVDWLCLGKAKNAGVPCTAVSFSSDAKAEGIGVEGTDEVGTASSSLCETVGVLVVVLLHGTVGTAAVGIAVAAMWMLLLMALLPLSDDTARPLFLTAAAADVPMPPPQGGSEAAEDRPPSAVCLATSCTP